jgi:hypothetical protein
VTPPVVKPGKQGTHCRCLRRPRLQVSAGQGAAEGVPPVVLAGTKKLPGRLTARVVLGCAGC